MLDFLVPPKGLGVPLWAQTPRPVRELLRASQAAVLALQTELTQSHETVATLRAELTQSQATLATLPAVIAEFEVAKRQYQGQVLALEGRIRELESRLKTNSSNSSKPPSSDFGRSARTPKRPPSGKSPGGQPGHPGKHRPLLPPDEVDNVLEYHPKVCKKCGTALCAEDALEDPRRQQIHELPVIKVKVTEYRFNRRRCKSCKFVTEATPPPEHPTNGSFGPRLQTEIALLTGRYRLSRREAKDYAEQAWGVELSLGAIMSMERNLRRALDAPFEEVWSAVKAASVRNIDETGWRQKNKRAWLWVAASKTGTAFKIAATRGRAVLIECFGNALENGYIGTDRYSAYKLVPNKQRGICHAHLKRDFVKMQERDASIGTEALAAQAKGLALYRAFEESELNVEAFRERLEPVKAELEAVLERGLHSADRKVPGMCRDILSHGSAIWNFADVPDLEPTNNSAERALRKGVLWRKSSFGTQSEHGSRFAERMLTVAETCRQNGHDLLAFMTAALLASMRGTPAPKLLQPPAPS